MEVRETCSLRNLLRNLARLRAIDDVLGPFCDDDDPAFYVKEEDIEKYYEFFLKDRFFYIETPETEEYTSKFLADEPPGDNPRRALHLDEVRDWNGIVVGDEMTPQWYADLARRGDRAGLVDALKNVADGI